MFWSLHYKKDVIPMEAAERGMFPRQKYQGPLANKSERNIEHVIGK